MLENLTIRSKIVSLLILPLAALAVFASSQVISTSRNSKEARGVNDISHFMPALIRMVDAAQLERGITLGYVGSSRRHYRSTMLADRVITNQAKRALDAEFAKLDLDIFSGRLRAQLTATVARADQLVNPKAQGYQRRAFEEAGSVKDVAEYYNQVIGDLLLLHNEIDAQTSDRNLARNLVTFTAVSRLKEAASEQQGILFAALAGGRFVGTQYADFTTATGEESAWRKQFRATAATEQTEFFDHTVKGPDVNRATAIHDAAIAAQDSHDLVHDLKNTPDLAGFNDATDWFFSARAKIDLLRAVEQKLAGDVGKLAGSVRTSTENRATVAFFLTIIVLEATIGFSLLMARSMARPLELLERSARDVAEQQLPGVVERLQQAQEVDLAAMQAEPVPIRSKDEIGRVAEAFNSVHQVATRVATEQAALRRSIGDMFVNLARRSQRLIDRQLNFIEELERDETDPDELAKLFQLDHMATRMRRNAENLIVLSSAESARRWSEPVPLADVIRAAISEVEDFTRVQQITVDEVQVSGHAVNDVVHLLAELVENATTFSSPETPVKIAGQAMPNGHLLEIEDCGIGMTDDQLAAANERLANPPMIDFALSRLLGFFVVSRLAQRYGIKVQLRHSWYGGVTALVLIPPGLLTQPGATQLSMTEAGEFPQDSRLAQLPPPPAPAMASVGRGGDLPIFEAARSEWFQGGAWATTHPPLRPEKMSESALPRRTPQENLAPGLATTAQPTAQPPPPPSGLTRSPDDIRNMLTSYRAGLRHGRLEATRDQHTQPAADPSDPLLPGSAHDMPH
ncbi:MAG TPA: nitrate- and nitrite sensing domain-containing protein [Actinomycetes bacterium]|jgi:signal transduction histidine kinase|nr:nitrate- and nitrite sensing domain-containing protein [Actinomycetes bacterium]